MLKFYAKNIGFFCGLYIVGASLIIGYSLAMYSPNPVLAICTALLILHVTFAYYFIVKKLPSMTVSEFATTLVGLIVGAVFCLAAVAALAWFVVVIAFFIVAMVFHYEVLSRNISPSVNKFCEYKLKLEVWIISATVVGIATVLVFARLTNLAPYGILLAILGTNYVMLSRHKPYSGF